MSTTAADARGSTDSVSSERATPPSSSWIVPLPRVHARLDAAAGGVALVYAPAGYGKTRQVALWAERNDRPVLWSDLDATHNDPGRLTARLASMLQTFAPLSPGEVDLPSVTAHPLMAVPAVTALFRYVERPVVIVLDDVHLIDDLTALDVLGAFVNNVPVGSMIVLIGRSEPRLTLGRLRVDDRVDEITAVDLALTASEARGIFESLGLDVDDAGIEEYVAATEGWPVGLRLAALALRDNTDAPSGELARDRILAEFVHDEWLRGLDADDMDFLLRLSGLEWMSGQLCDEILGRSDSGARLERLHRSRLLVVPLDRRGDAYRMHSLLREVLDADFERLDRAERGAIDLAASAWFERRGDIDRAVRHAMRFGDRALVRELVVRHAPTLHTRGRYATVQRWLEQLSPDSVLADPALCLVASLTAVGLGRDEEAQAWVRHGLGARRSTTDGEDDITHLELLVFKSLLSVGPLAESLADAVHAHERLPPGTWHAAACEAIGVLSAGLGRADLAESMFVEGAAEAQITGAATVQATCRSQLAASLGRRGDWTTATALARSARELVRCHGLEHMPSMVVVTAMSAHAEALAGDAATARAEVLLTRRNLAYVGGIAVWANVQARLSLAHASLLLSDRAGARVLVDEAEAFLRAQSDAVAWHAEIEEIVERVAAARGVLPVGPSSLTTAELRVLHLLPTNLSIADIAERLYVSRNTTKSHAAAIYRKFGVSSRGAAVSVAREVGLLPP